MVQLRIGGKYRTRDGKHVVEITHLSSWMGYDYGSDRTSIRMPYWTVDGCYRRGRETSQDDLVEEVLAIKPNTYYRTHDGRMAFVSAITLSPFSEGDNCFRGFIKGLGPTGWNLNGKAFVVNAFGERVYPDHSAGEDLVAPWSDPVEVQLNAEYKAVVTDVVTVGCQQFPIGKIEELAQAARKYAGQL